MGRPPLSKSAATVVTQVRLPADMRRRIEALVGPHRMAEFIRQAVEAELARREAEAGITPPGPAPENKAP